MNDKMILVAGGGGFIGGHLVAHFRELGYTRIRSVDVKPFDQWYQQFDDVENVQADLKLRDACIKACRGVSEVYNLAADMGGMGFIENNKALCMLSVLINTHLLQAARKRRSTGSFMPRRRVFTTPISSEVPRRDAAEGRATPIRRCRKTATAGRSCFRSGCAGISARITESTTRVARFHNVYGPHGTWDGGREKAPAAICRKVIHAMITGQSRDRNLGRWQADPQLHVYRRLRERHRQMIMHSNIEEPINLGSDELTTINGLVEMVEDIAGVELKHTHNLSAPKGVNGRNSDNTLIKKYLDWAPDIRLREGMERTYDWIHEEYTKANRGEIVRT